MNHWLTDYIAFVPTSVNRFFAYLDTQISIMEQLPHANRPFVYFLPVDGGYLCTLHVYSRKASWNKM